MKNKTKLIFLPVLLAVIFLSAFAQPVPLFATPLPEGRSLDETHNTGYIDWHGAVGYINLFHRDGICSSGCTEQVTRIINGASVSGAFAADVDYFEVGVSASHSNSVGSAVLTACSSSDTLNLHTAGSGPPGFVSFSLAVPAGCRTWSLTAAGGYVDFRSVDANYGTPPPASTSTKSRTPTRRPPSTVTSTPLMTKTPTKTVTIALTSTLTITATASPSETMTITLTPTVSETLAPGVTPPKTPIPTITDTPSASATFTTTLTPSKTIILTGTYTLSPSTVTPIYTRLPGGTNTPARATTKTKRPPRNKPTATIAFAGASRTAPPSVQTRTFTPPPARTRTPTPPSVLRTPTFSSNNVVLNATPTPICGPSAPGTGGLAGGVSFDFSWLGLLTAAGSLAAALSLLRSLQQGSSSSSLTIRVPHLVQRKTTVGEWVSTPVKVWVLVTNTVWRAVVEAIPHFIDVLRQVVDQIFHSKWVTSTIWVLQTIYQNVWEQVPLLSWLGTIIGWLWQWVLKPILTWVAQTIQTLYTWVENVVRWVVERIQDGWDYITHWVAETISKWVEQTDWVQKWVTKEITIWDTEWETVPVPLPAALSAANLKILAKLGITITLGIVSLTQCTPTTNPLPTPDAIATQVACIRTQVAGTAFAAVTQTVVAGYTPTPVPTATVTPFQFPSNKVFTANETLFTCNDVALYYGISLADLQAANPDLNCDAVNIGTTKFNIPPILLKTPSDDVSQYTCTPTTEKPKCLSPDATAEEMIAYTLFNEGGSSEGSQFSANVMQVMLNHANKVLDNWGIDRSQMSRDDYAKMVLYVISKPAAAGANVAAFEAFSSSSEPPASSGPSADNWNVATQIAQAVLDNKGQDWGNSLPKSAQPDDYIQNKNALFYCSVKQQSGEPPLGSVGQIPQPGGDSPGGVYTYFFNGYQYDQSVAQWCQDNR